MGALSNIEQEAVERASAEPMLAQVEAWAAVNSGSRNLAGLETTGRVLADAFSVLPCEMKLEAPAPVESVDPCGREIPIDMQGRRAGDPSHLVADSSKARSVLGWQPQHAELAKIISSAWDWHTKS